MKKLITYCLLLVGFMVSCEDVYDPDIDAVENVIVADARILYGGLNNIITINKSLGFTEKSSGYSAIAGGEVTMIDNNGEEYVLAEIETGRFAIDFDLNPELNYKLKIDYLGDTFESSFESVPKAPVLDTVYGIAETKIIKTGGENDVGNFKERSGLQLYADIVSETEMPNYRFTSRKVMQYTYNVMVPMMGELIPETMYAWKSFFPQETFNIASPPEYSSSKEIHKHPLFFLEERGYTGTEESFAGWILIMYQHGLSKTAYNYYKDLNNQLESDGRLFDPLYVQARSNIKCVNNEDQLILGNFEIFTAKQYRYFVKFLSAELGYIIKPIPYFYDIPLSGEQLSEQPDFWEYPGKHYPDE